VEDLNIAELQGTLLSDHSSSIWTIVVDHQEKALGKYFSKLMQKPSDIFTLVIGG
jgi:hypothetical protein